MWRFEHELEVLFRDCDPMGHVNNAVYLTYLEAARFAWWRNAFGAQGLKEHGFIVARVEIDYRKAALPGDRLLVRLRVEDIGRFELQGRVRDPERQDARAGRRGEERAGGFRLRAGQVRADRREPAREAGVGRTEAGRRRAELQCRLTSPSRSASPVRPSCPAVSPSLRSSPVVDRRRASRRLGTATPANPAPARAARRSTSS